jgi:hypothetical protein
MWAGRRLLDIVRGADVIVIVLRRLAPRLCRRRRRLLEMRMEHRRPLRFAGLLRPPPLAPIDPPRPSPASALFLQHRERGGRDRERGAVRMVGPT